MCGLIGVVTARAGRSFEEFTRENFEIHIAGLKYLKRRGPNSLGAGFINPFAGKIGSMSFTRSIDDRIIKELKGLAFNIRASVSLGQTKWLTDYTDGENSLEKAVLAANTQPIHIYFDGMYGLKNEGLGIQNGNIPKQEKEKMMALLESPSPIKATVDTRYLTELYMQKIRESGDEWEAAKWIIENVGGAYAFGYSQGDSLIAFKDKRGYRPLCIGKKERSTVFCSESGFFEEMGIDYIKEIKPGEMVRINNEGEVEARVLVEAEHAHCPFCDIYFKDWFSRSNREDITVTEVREKMGAALFLEYQDKIADLDIVSFAPDSGKSYAYGFADAAGKRIVEALRKPLIKDTERHFLIRGKHHYVPNSSRIKGKNIAVFDDSIMRGGSIIEMYKTLKDAGVEKVYFFSAWPPNVFFCDKGIDTPTNEELIAHRLIRDGVIKYRPGEEIRYEINEVNQRMTEIIRQEIRENLGSGYNPNCIYVFYGSLDMLRSNLPIDDNCEFCITGVDPELRTSKLLLS